MEKIVAEKCGVDEAALVAGEGCGHFLELVKIPRWLRNIKTSAVGAAEKAEEVYVTEILEKDYVKPVDEEAIDERLTTMPELYCEECCQEWGKGSVVLLNNWTVLCRTHAEKKILRTHPNTPWVVCNPNGNHTTVYCTQCHLNISWSRTHPSLQFFPAKDDDLDADSGLCLQAATAAAEALSWHSFKGPNLTPFLNTVSSIFLLSTGVDRDGVGSEWSKDLYGGMLTEYGCVLHAAVGVTEDGYEGVWMGEESGVEEKCVFGFLLTVDDEPEEGDVVSLGEKVGAILEKEPLLCVSVRQVWDSLGSRWVKAVIPHLPPPTTATTYTHAKNPDHYAPLEDVQQHKDIAQTSPDSDEDSFDAPPTKGESTWIQFFMAAYHVAMGIIHVGEVMEEQRVRRE